MLSCCVGAVLNCSVGAVLNCCVGAVLNCCVEAVLSFCCFCCIASALPGCNSFKYEGIEDWPLASLHLLKLHAVPAVPAVPAVQCVIRDTFLGPAELAGVYAATLLNLHPPT